MIGHTKFTLLNRFSLNKILYRKILVVILTGISHPVLIHIIWFMLKYVHTEYVYTKNCGKFMYRKNLDIVSIRNISLSTNWEFVLAFCINVKIVLFNLRVCSFYMPNRILIRLYTWRLGFRLFVLMKDKQTS